MKSWRFTIEFTGGSDDSAPPEIKTSEAWESLRDARRRMLESLHAGVNDKVESINLWIGGALSTFAKLTGGDSQELLDRLSVEIPNTTPPPIVPPDVAEFVHVERDRPKPHPGAQRKLDLSELTPEEREELGIITPGEDEV